MTNVTNLTNLTDPFPAWLPQRARWIAEAQKLTPDLKRHEVRPARLVTLHEDASAFQGWAVAEADESDPASLAERALGKGDSVTLDFGEHHVGYVRLRLASDRWFNDAPVRLKVILGEAPAEVAEPFDPYPGQLSRAWLQDVQIDVDELPAELALPRRYAFRYMRIDVVDTSRGFKVRIGDIRCETVTSAGPDQGTPPTDPIDQALDAVSLRTLRNCMQTVFEDGPKRDRRLWLGDLRLEALTNAVSFRNFDLVKRCLLLHAGFARDADGIVPACVFERPVPVTGHCFILDYAALFGPTLLDYARASGDGALAHDLWPVALRQVDYCLERVDPATDLFRDPGGWWLFLDWHASLNKESGLHAVILYAARQTAELGRLLGCDSDAARLEAEADRMAAAARERLRDPATGLYVSGPNRQVSWATQAWMVLAGVPETTGEAAALFDSLAEAGDTALLPAGPYLWHHIVDALYACGREAQAKEILHTYWGAMLGLGATTFWEVFDPKDERLSPYDSHLVNSYCHAWSCTPAYFLRGGRDRPASTSPTPSDGAV